MSRRTVARLVSRLVSGAIALPLVSLPAILTTSALCIAGCGSTATKGGVQPGSDAATSPSDTGSTSNDGDAAAETAVSAPTVGTPATFVSNIPGAVTKDIGTTPAPNLRLASVNFIQTTGGGETFQTWIGEVVNEGTTNVCQLQLVLTYLDASGDTLVATDTTYAEGTPSLLGTSTLDSPCIPPGSSGAFFAINSGVEITLADVATIGVAYAYDSFSGSFTVDPDAPTLVASPAAATATGTSGYDLAGTIVGGPIDVYNLAVNVYPRDATGMFYAQLQAFDLGTLSAGGSDAFTSTSTPTNFGAYASYLTFLHGDSTTAAFFPHDGEEAEARAIEVARRKSAAEAAVRVARMNASRK